MAMTRDGHGGPVAIDKEEIEKKLKMNVVDKFKKLHDDKSNRKEKLDTWKYAATEIVDLLQSVRSEGDYMAAYFFISSDFSGLRWTCFTLSLQL